MLVDLNYELANKRHSALGLHSTSIFDKLHNEHVRKGELQRLYEAEKDKKEV